MFRLEDLDDEQSKRFNEDPLFRSAIMTIVSSDSNKRIVPFVIGDLIDIINSQQKRIEKMILAEKNPKITIVQREFYD